MKKNSSVFLLIEVCIYCCFLYIDITGIGNSNWIKYTGILLCVWYALYHAKDRNGYLIAAALCFTAAADFFLLLLDQCYVLGISLFLIVQTLYMIRLLSVPGQHLLAEGILRCAVPVLLLSVLAHYHLLEPVTFLSAIYFSTLFTNGIKSICRLGICSFTVGLLLFICCDVSIGLRNIITDPPYYTFFSVAIWTFYLPSQVLLALNAVTIRKDKGDFFHVSKT